MKKNILCIVAHPDDEVLMCGATLAQHTIRGDTVSVIAVTDNTLRHNSGSDLTHFQKSTQILGVQSAISLEFKDQGLDVVRLDKLITKISNFITVVPDLIYTHSLSDLNRDHRAIAEAVLVLYRIPTHSIEILGGYVGSSTEYGMTSFRPDTFISVSIKEVNLKIKALECYLNEIKIYPHPRSSRGLMNQVEYFGNQIGVEFAEPFETLKRVVI